MNNVRLINKNYLNQHPIDEYSAANIEYTMNKYPDLFKAVDDVLPEFRKRTEKFGIKNQIDVEKIKIIEQEEDTERLLRMFRQAIPPDAKKKIIAKLLEREDEVLPEIQRIILKAFNDNTIENTTRYMIRCKTNCSDWILRNYKDIREPYARSMLCLVLGFRGDDSCIPFLMEQVELFEKQFPQKSFNQGPLLALYELRERFQ